MITFLLFANMREAAGVPSVSIKALPEGSTMADAWSAICDALPALSAWTGRVAFARNGEYVSESCLVADNDELAAIPPVSGG